MEASTTTIENVELGNGNNPPDTSIKAWNPSGEQKVGKRPAPLNHVVL